MNKMFRVSLIGDCTKNEEAVELLVANARRGQTGVLMFKDTGSDRLILAPWKQRLVEKMANRILSSETVFKK